MADESAETLLINGNKQFTANFFSEVAKNETGKSVVMSGFSALSPLAQLGLASVGDSHDEILKTIGMPNDKATKDAFSLINHKLSSAKGVELKVANRVYIANDCELSTTFTEMSREVCSSDFQNIDFSKNVEAAATINAWVEDSTNKRIKHLVNPDSFNKSTKAILVNAIYFKGSWETKFKKELTKGRDFHVSNEKTIEVPTMFRKGDFKYGRSKELDAQLLELPYGAGEAAFLVVLPYKIDGITQLQEKLKEPSLLAKAVQNMRKTEVNVFLPKFRIETTIDLKQVLEKIGVKNIFYPKEAKLNYPLEGDTHGLYVNNAIQKAFIEVNEEGTEAAATSGFRMVKMCANPRFMANKPFYFELIIKNVTLFSGKVHEPHY